MEQRILIVDDERHTRFSAGLALKQRGYCVEEAVDGREAFDKIQQAREEGSPVRLMITDIQMPPAGGLELLDRLKRAHLEIPVLIISGHYDETLFQELVKRNYLDYMEKPLALDDLVSRVDHLMEKDG